MNGLRILVLTDHSAHSAENSLYALLHAIRRHPGCAHIDVASRATLGNRAFFTGLFANPRLYATRVDEAFNFSILGKAFRGRLRRVKLSDYDSILLRLPPPFDPIFGDFLIRRFPPERIVNSPKGIARTSSKSFLLEVSHLCPPTGIVNDKHDLMTWREKFPFVLKPLYNYGGKGIIKVDGYRVWVDGQEQSFDHFSRAFAKNQEPMLAMRYLNRVNEGDKRIVVCCGMVMGASLRIPPEGSWLCNAAQGGQSVATTLTPEEQVMARQLSRRLQDEGVVIFGFDTLVDDDGKRVLSEINTMSIGGLKQIEMQSGTPVLRDMVELLIEHIKQKIYGPECVDF